MPPRQAILPAILAALLAPQAQAAEPTPWVAAWTASAQGPYPIGNPTAQPELKFALPGQRAEGQTFRLIVRPDVWSDQTRIRLSNTYGDKPVTFDAASIALQSTGSTLVPNTTSPVTFQGQPTLTLQPGQSTVSDPVALPWVKNPTDPMLANRKLAISLHVAGQTGKLTWHAKALTTSYLSAQKSAAAAEPPETEFPYSTTSWFFLDEVDMNVPGATTIVTYGDSITDGTASTINGDDRWPDVFARRVHAKYGNKFSIVNEGIGGNMIAAPNNYAETPIPGGPSALDRLERDVISLPNVSHVIWLEGINDFDTAGLDADPANIETAVKTVVTRLRQAIPNVKIDMATLTSALHSDNAGHGTPAADAKRKTLNQFIRTSGLFDAQIDFDAATLDPTTGEIKPEYQPNSSTGGPGDKLHPNRAGYSAMARSIDLEKILPPN